MEKIKLIIADDETIMRQSLALALSKEESFIVIGQTANGQQLLDLVEKDVPDIILLDLKMPVMDGWEALSLLKKHHPEIKVIVVSIYVEGSLIKDLVERGACGFITKDSDLSLLVHAIHDVNILGYFFNDSIPNTVVEKLMVSKAINPLFNQVILTKEEQDTLKLICRDKTTKEIAELLNISARTVERYKTRLYEKTKAKTSAGLILYALKHEFFEP